MRRVLVCVFWLASGLAAQISDPFFFIQGSDPQFGHFAKNKDLSQGTANFQFFIATVNRLKPAFVVLTGDLVNRARNPEQIAEFKRIAAGLDKSIPLYLLPGNHDISDHPEPMHLEAWRKNFGADHWAFRKADTVFIGFNSALVNSVKAPPDEVEKQYVWLQAELAKARREGARRVILFQHHSWFLSSFGEEDRYVNIPATQRHKYFQLFRTYGVTHIFAGHMHQNCLASTDGIEMVTTGAIGLPRGEERSGFRIVTVRDSAVAHQYYDFGVVPNQVTVQ